MTYQLPFIKAINGLQKELNLPLVSEQEIIPEFDNFAVGLGLWTQNCIQECLILDRQTLSHVKQKNHNEKWTIQLQHHVNYKLNLGTVNYLLRLNTLFSNKNQHQALILIIRVTIVIMNAQMMIQMNKQKYGPANWLMWLKIQNYGIWNTGALHHQYYTRNRNV